MQLSVIVCVVDAGEQLERCLAALASQDDAPPLDVIVPWDDSLSGMAAFAARYPSFRFPAIGAVKTHADPGSHAGLHELYDARRTAGLHAAAGALVALLEDRSVPEPGWAREAVRLHAAHPNVVIGGALASGRDSVVSLADYLCDFYRFQPPFTGGVRDYVSYVNLCYKRAALERTRALWQDGYYDLTVHWALQKEGEKLWLAPEFLVMQQRGDGAKLRTLIGERFAWGRRFAVRRAKEAGVAARLRYALQSPIVPIVLYLRAARAQNGKSLGDLLKATPAMLLIFGAWGFGEMIGSIAGGD